MELNRIQKSVQEVAEAISSILKVDVSIVNSDLVRIAATGSYKQYIGEKLQYGCSYDYILKNQKSELIIDKNISDRCNNCFQFNSCEEVATIGYPIISNSKKILGVIGLIAFNENQKEYINKNLNNIDNFLKKLTSLLAGNLSYEETISNLFLKNKEISNITNSLDYGIIITNDKKNITYYNKKAKHLLNLDGDINCQNITNIFYNIDKIQENLITRSKISNRKEEFLVKIIENTIKDGSKSYIFTFSKLSNVFLKAYSVLNNIENINFSNIIGESLSMKNSITLARQVSNSSAAIILRGEEGTEKELFAKAIHNESDSKTKPFISINFKLMSDNLIEKELFGYEVKNDRGVCIDSKIGFFELANNGTLFFQEIDRIPLHLQRKILNVLETKKFIKLGTDEEKNTNFKIISSTSIDLEKAVRENKFLSDLYYKINVIPINIPPLRERQNDILLIAENKIKECCLKLGKEQMYMDEKLKNIFKRSLWSKNIIELENVIEYLVNISNNKMLTEEMLPQYFLKITSNENIQNNSFDLKYILESNLSLKDANEYFEKKILEAYLNEHGNNTKAKEKISELLKINLSTLYRKIYRYALD